MSPVRAEPLRLAQDARGFVVEPLGGDELAAQRNAHVVFTAPGKIRGNHYHTLGTEVMVVVGPALVRVREAGTVRDFQIPEGEIHRFVFPPRVSHAVQGTGEDPLLVIAFNTTEHDPANPDVVRDELIAG